MDDINSNLRKAIDKTYGPGRTRFSTPADFQSRVCIYDLGKMPKPDQPTHEACSPKLIFTVSNAGFDSDTLLTVWSGEVNDAALDRIDLHLRNLGISSLENLAHTYRLNGTEKDFENVLRAIQQTTELIVQRPTKLQLTAAAQASPLALNGQS